VANEFNMTQGIHLLFKEEGKAAALVYFVDMGFRCKSNNE